MESVFSRAYSYRQREDKNNLENYVIEIFAFCLESDPAFRQSFLNLIGIQSEAEFDISTQSSYPGLGRPDIEIESKNDVVLVECKIEHEERENQLSDYKVILDRKNKKRKTLIFLTKYYQAKSFDCHGVNYVNVKWLEVKDLILDVHNETTRQLGNFLTEQNIAMDKNFNTRDILALETIMDTISKMDETLDAVKDYAADQLGPLTNSAARNTWLSRGAYLSLIKIGKPHKFNIDLGFLWWSSEEAIKLTTQIWINKKSESHDELLKVFREHLKSWNNPYDAHKGTIIGSYLNVNEKVAVEEEQIPVMIDFLRKNIDQLVELKKLEPKLFK